MFITLMEMPWAMITQKVNDARLTDGAVLCAFRKEFNELIGTDMLNVVQRVALKVPCMNRMRWCAVVWPFIDYTATH